MTTEVRVDASGVMKNLEELQKRIDGRDRNIMRYATAAMERETRRAFASQSDPNTGRPWAQRKESYPWPLLRRSGQLLSVLRWGYGIKTRDKKLKLFGKVKDGFARGAFTRGGGGIAKGARKPFIVVAGAVHFGRRHARSAAMWKPKRGKMVFHGGGTKLTEQTASTGTTPPRPFFGFGRSERKRIKHYAEKRLARVFK